jgi:glycine C-acetyltransferase
MGAVRIRFGNLRVLVGCIRIMNPTTINSDNFTMADFYGESNRDIFAKTAPLKAFIDDWKDKGTYTYWRLLTSSCTNSAMVDGDVGRASRKMVMLASNNYLGLNSRVEVADAAVAALRKYGTGMGGAPILNGTYDLLRELERRLARFERREAALVFTTGYQTNVGTISALMRPKDIVLIDRLSHASIVDGCRLAGCKFRSFKHNDMANLELVLKSSDQKYCGKLIVMDGVFSMDGDIAPLPEIIRLAQKYGARVMVDEAHGSGVLGPTGRGAVEHFGLEDKVDIVMGTFSKTFGSTGGYIAGSEEVVSYVRHYARAYLFSASPTPSSVATVLAALDIVENEPQLRERLWDNVRYFHAGLKRLGFTVFPDQPESAVMVVVVGDDVKLRLASRAIHEAGVFLSSVIYPAVGKNQSRFRISLTAIHTRDDLDKALSVLAAVGEAYNIRKTLL